MNGHNSVWVQEACIGGTVLSVFRWRENVNANEIISDQLSVEISMAGSHYMKSLVDAVCRHTFQSIVSFLFLFPIELNV